MTWTRRPYAAALLAVLVSVGSPGPAAAAGAGDLAGVWARTGRFGQTRMTFAADGTWQRETGPEGEVVKLLGRYAVKDKVVEIRTTDGQTLRYVFERSGAELTLADREGALTMDRVGAAPATLGDVPLPAPGYDNTPLAPKVRNLAAHPAGHIAFARYEVPGGAIPPRRRIYLMAGNGQGATPLIQPKGLWEAFEPSWSRDGKKLVFASNFEPARSALLTDVFLADLSTGTVRRITGNERPAAESKGTTTLVVTPVGTIVGKDPSVVYSGMNITCQGQAGKLYKLAARGGARAAVIPDAPANQVIWVKMWMSTHIGGLAIIKTGDPGTKTLVKVDVNRGNHLATRPTLTPDGKGVMVLWQHATFNPKPRTKPRIPPVNFSPNPTPPEPSKPEKFAHEEGEDTLALVSVAKGTPPVAVWEPNRLAAQYAKQPALSPDGSAVAFAMGVLPTESIAICPVAALGPGRSKKIVAGQLHPGVGAVGNGYPAWSPDGTKLAFCQVRSDLSGNFTANLGVVNVDGTGARQVTRVGLNQAAVYPTWSPDAKRIAFQLLTSRRNALNALDVAAMNVTSDIWSVAADGSGLAQLTKDGRSVEPAWGP